MKKLEVQKYLETKSFDDLEKELGVEARLSENGDHLVNLCYGINSVPGPIVNECRGLILKVESYDLSKAVGPTIVMAYPFTRFYNYGQPGAADVDIATAKFFLKIDGSMMTMFHDGYNWRVSSKKVIDADQRIGNESKALSTLFWDAVSRANMDLSLLPKNKTYIFELVGRHNKVVIDYDLNVFLLGVRNNETFEEEDVTSFNCSFDVPPFYRLDSIEKAIEFVNSKNGAEFEGVVAVDKNFNRVKVKNIEHMKFNRLKDKAESSPLHLLEFILLEKDDDVAVTLPEYLVQEMSSIKKKLGLYSGYVSDKAQKLAPTTDRKEAAIFINNNYASLMEPIMFMWSGKGNFAAWLKSKEKNGGYQDAFLKSILKEIKKF